MRLQYKSMSSFNVVGNVVRFKVQDINILNLFVGKFVYNEKNLSII